jgi:TonB family protein
VGGGVSAPALLHKVEPQYSEEARQAGIEGRVVLYVEIDPDGRAVNPRIVRGLEHGLNKKAIEAVEKWQFRPGYKDGKPVTVAATIEVNFRLTDRPKMPTGITSPESRITVLRTEAASAEMDAQFAVAEEKLNEALRESATLSARLFHVKTDLLRDLGNLYFRQKKMDEAESTYKLRLDTLKTHQSDGQAPDLDIGIALFDLQSIYESTARNRDAEEYFEGARTFYENCKKSFPNLAAVCDRRLADAESLHGSELFLQKRFDAAVPFLRAVIAREDSEVRPEVLHAALSAYAQILVSKSETAAARPLIERALRISAANPELFPYRSLRPPR